jgi:hypothetical protein
VAPVLCAEQEVPRHVRHRALGLLRTQVGATFGLGKGFQLAANLPLDARFFGTRYETESGADFDPPYETSSQDNQTLIGLGDGLIRANYYGRPQASFPLLIGGGLGLSLPTGRIPKDPNLLALEGEEGRRFGTGTFDPTAALAVVFATRPVGAILMAGARVPLYENLRGLRGSISTDLAAGPMFRLPAPADKIRVLLLASWSHIEPEVWFGVPTNNSGGDVVAANLGLEWSVHPQVVLQARVRVNAGQWLRGNQARQIVTGTLGFSGLLNLVEQEHH